jgi:hypothetical protein
MASVDEILSRIECLVADFEHQFSIMKQNTDRILGEIVSIKSELAPAPAQFVDVVEEQVASTDAEASSVETVVGEATVAEAEADTEVIKVLDTLGPDYMQCYLPGDIRDVCAEGKTIALAFSCDMRVRVTTPNDTPADGTVRRIRNAGVNELQIVLCELDIELAILQPNEVATLVFRDGTWVAEF